MRILLHFISLQTSLSREMIMEVFIFEKKRFHNLKKKKFEKRDRLCALHQKFWFFNNLIKYSKSQFLFIFNFSWRTAKFSKRKYWWSSTNIQNVASKRDNLAVYTKYSYFSSFKTSSFIKQTKGTKRQTCNKYMSKVRKPQDIKKLLMHINSTIKMGEGHYLLE